MGNQASSPCCHDEAFAPNGCAIMEIQRSVSEGSEQEKCQNAKKPTYPIHPPADPPAPAKAATANLNTKALLDDDSPASSLLSSKSSTSKEARLDLVTSRGSTADRDEMDSFSLDGSARIAAEMNELRTARE